jgi:hypothetical protein
MTVGKFPVFGVSPGTAKRDYPGGMKKIYFPRKKKIYSNLI